MSGNTKSGGKFGDFNKQGLKLNVGLGFFPQKGGTVPKRGVETLKLNKARMHDEPKQVKYIEKYEDNGKGSIVKEKICLDLYSLVGKVPTSQIALRDRDYMEHLLVDYFVSSGTPEHDAKDIVQMTLNSAQNVELTYGKPDDLKYVTFMGKFVKGYADLGNGFVDAIGAPPDYCPPDKVITKEGNEYPLVGLMKIAAMAKIMGDPDWLGGSGGNTGYVINEEERFAMPVLVDAGLALTKSPGEVPRGQDSKDIQFSNFGSCITFESLTEAQKEEYIGTLYQFTSLDEEQLKEHLFALVYRNGVFNTNKDRNGEPVTLLEDDAAIDMVDKIMANITELKVIYQDELELYRHNHLGEPFSMDFSKPSKENVFAQSNQKPEEIISTKFLIKNGVYSTEILGNLRDLVVRIEAEIAHCEKQHELHPKMERYEHKIKVLEATKNYICGNIGLDILQAYKDQYPKWNKAFGRSNTEYLVNEALDLKGEKETYSAGLR